MITLAAPPADLHTTDSAGVFHIPAAQLNEFISATNAARGSVQRVQLHGVRGKADLLARFAEALQFPDWFGQNWDALADCLSDLSWLQGSPPRILLIEGLSGREEALPILFEILEQAVSDSAERGVALWVFIPQEAEPAA